MAPLYACGGCGLAILILPDVAPIRACQCDAPIVANLTASLEGQGGIR